MQNLVNGSHKTSFAISYKEKLKMNKLKKSSNFPLIHPGTILKEEVLNVSGLTVTGAADMLKISRPMLSNIINGKSAITASMAIRIAAVFGGSPDVWVNLQSAYELRKAEMEFAVHPVKFQSVA